jgi:hypothetical protein
MKILLTTILVLAASMGRSHAETEQHCPVDTVFLALEDQVRGYPARANGPTAPCQILQGAATGLSTARTLSISVHRYLHVAQFLTDGTANLFPGDTDGNVSPSRTEIAQTNDLIGIATDSAIDDFVISNRHQPSEVIVFLNGGISPAYTFYPQDLAQVWSIAVDGRDDVLVAGYSYNGDAVVDTYETSKSLSAPVRIRRLHGAATGLLRGDPASFAGNTISIAIDPSSQELYVYNATSDYKEIQISVFRKHANGDVAPGRVIAGTSTQLGPNGLIGTNKISISADGRIFDAEANNRILVFAPDVTGNATPSQVIRDSTIASAQLGQGGIAVRSR